MSSAPSSTFTPSTTITGKRLAVGFGWGVFASIVMFAFMYIAMLVITTAFAKGLPDPLLIALMVASVLLYYGFGGAVLAGLTRPVKIWHGIVMGCSSGSSWAWWSFPSSGGASSDWRLLP